MPIASAVLGRLQMMARLPSFSLSPRTEDHELQTLRTLVTAAAQPATGAASHMPARRREHDIEWYD